MRFQYNKIVCFLLAVVLAFGCIAGLCVPAAAAYENTHVNTGNQRQDIISVALTQVGYKEGPGNSNGNDTKYGQWWGHNPMAWCAVFVSWCADQAGIPESVIKQSSFSNAPAFGFSSTFNAYQKTPQPGDLFFRNTNAHVGIVYKVEGDTFYTLEGNTWTSADPRHGVMIRQRDLYSSSYTFVSPNYSGSSGGGNSMTTTPSCSHNYVKGADAAHPHKEYYQCSKCNHQYYTGTEKTVDTCKECKQENCSHSYSSWEKNDTLYHVATCTLCEKVKKELHTWGNDEVITPATCVEPGKLKQTCEGCGIPRESEIPATGEHQYSSIVYINSEKHHQVCELCGEEEEAPHTVEQWSASATEHWYTCSDCGGRLDIGTHILSGSCNSACVICDFTPNSGHMYSAKWSSNAKSHWHRCVNCANVKGEEEHIYSAECDETCDICGYSRNVTHTYDNEWKNDATSHWQECTKCGQIKALKAHTPGPAATETRGQYCTDCYYEIAPIQQHTHRFTYTHDTVTHWGACSCGETRPAENHVWQMSTGKCQICHADQIPAETNPVVLGIKLPAAFKTQWLWQILLICFGGIIAIVVLAILIGAIRRGVQASAAARLRREFDEEDGWEDDPETLEEVPAEDPVTEEDSVPV